MVTYPLLAAVTTTGQFMKPALIILASILGVMVLGCLIFSLTRRGAKGRDKTGKVLLGAMYAATIIVLVCTVLCWRQYSAFQNTALQGTADTGTTAGTTTQVTTEATTDATTEATTVPPTVPKPPFKPAYTDKTNPDNFGVKWEIIQNGSIVDTYTREEAITFGEGREYTGLEGLITFRGNNYREGASYGTVDVKDKTLTQKWSSEIGALNGWTGSGWTGQPLIVRWDDETKAIMNLYEDKKTKADLVEVIYATLDGYVYFYDLDDGSYTRDPVWIGMNFKGAGALDPRGYPLMYVGSGDVANGKVPRMYIISLIDGKILYERSGSDSFALRPWYAFDSSPLVDAETDTLIWPGESGILYTIKLNTLYDPAGGTISISPQEAAKVRYTTKSDKCLGSEASCILVDNYLYMGDNGGWFFCVDINTMELVWAQDTKDDVNATPVFQWGEDGNGYIYTGSSMEYQNGVSYVYKLDAQTGEIIWEKTFDGIPYDKDVSGGILSSPVLGKEGTSLEGLILYSVSKTPEPWSGTLAALNTETGEVVWQTTLSNYCWSSPVAVYTENGDGYIVICDSAGNVRLLDGVTGEILSTVQLGSNIEASPAVFGDTLVVGTRGQKIYGVKIG